MTTPRNVQVVTTIAALRTLTDASRAADRTVGLVPTMGFLHAGHRSLMRAARAANDVVIVTLFVNPTQFGANEDFSKYPRDFEGDRAVCAAEGVDAIFAPTVEEMYPEPGCTTVHVAGLTDGLCGASRPGHFDGVTTIVARLFSIVGPCRAYFGRKDAQQLAVIVRMARDLDLPVEVIGCPLVREAGGLALSSRNAYLTPEERTAALVIARALHATAAAVIDGARDADTLRKQIIAALETESIVRLDYAEIVDAHDLNPIGELAGDVLVAVAATVGRTRLIDNVALRIDGADVDADLGVVTAGHDDA